MLVATVVAAVMGCGDRPRTADTVAARAETSRIAAVDSPRVAADTAIAPTGAAPTPAAATASKTSPSSPAASTPSKPRTAAPTPTAAGATGGVAAPSLSQQDVDREIARAVAAWSRIRTLRASFQQVVTNPITGSELTAKGTLQQQKPGRLAIDFSDPAGDRIVADGEYVWVYLQSATPGQVVKMRVTDVGAANTDLIGQFLNTPRSKYDAADAGADRVNGRATRIVTLTAKPGQALPFIRAKVWVDSVDALIRQFDAVDANGISRKVRILSMAPNASVDASAFRFTVPAGVRVVDR